MLFNLLLAIFGSKTIKDEEKLDKYIEELCKKD